jgi:serine/threonine protein kinase
MVLEDAMQVTDEPSVSTDGRAIIGDSLLRFPNLTVNRVIGSGANGVLFRARQEFLERDMAVKVWLKLRPKDQSDKFFQGIEEARRTANAHPGGNIVQIYDAGAIGRFFYATMDYFPGITCRDWLTWYQPSLRRRLRLASGVLHSLTAAMDDAVRPGAVHGDPHPGNILVRYPWLPSDEPRSYPWYLIVDFGTSAFKSHEYSVKRHWRELHKTVNILLRPLDIDALWSHKKTEHYSNAADRWMAAALTSKWYHDFFDEIKPMLESLGAPWDHRPDQRTPYPDDHVRRELERLVSSGRLKLDWETLGHDWVRDD